MRPRRSPVPLHRGRAVKTVRLVLLSRTELDNRAVSRPTFLRSTPKGDFALGEELAFFSRHGMRVCRKGVNGPCGQEGICNVAACPFGLVRGAPGRERVAGEAAPSLLFPQSGSSS